MRKFRPIKLYEETIISHGHHVCIGTPEMIADEMQHWIEQEAADGFNIVPALLPESLSDFAEQVVPESAALTRLELLLFTTGQGVLPPPPPTRGLKTFAQVNLTA